MYPRPNQRTLDLYNEVLENVIRNVGDEWRESGGDFNVLQSISEQWAYQTKKRCNIECVEPQSQPLKRAKQKQEAKNDDLFKLFQPPKEETSSDSSDSSSSPESPKSESSSDLGDSDSNSSKSSSSNSDNKSDDGLGEDSDGEASSMVAPIKARDILFCQYTYESKKRKKGARGFLLNVVNCHFTIDGIPRVVKNGTINFQ
ncbi:hypothetical protein M9Y10_044005 [Tritrichomonas musculus]|uniref:Uncharacterized protein n=1 Tax=Tritrichomonas musculus TaxID=1915356 RepID=A0ABR2K1A3_9EUKA